MVKSNVVHPLWARNLTIYEVNLRQYTPSGTIREFRQHLPRLKNLGVGILWFMPLQPIGLKNRKGTLGSYYSIMDYTSLNPEFGTISEFKALVDEIHRLGMYVIIDWVANHTAWDHHWTKEYPEFYDLDDKGNFKPPFPEWEDVIHLNYNNPALWDEMISSMRFWIENTGIDGFRCDMAHLVPTLFWNRARYELDKNGDLYFLAETENHDLLEYAFDTIYNWKLLHALNDTAAGKINAARLGDLIINELGYFPENATQLNFTCNHDENSWNGSAIERLHYFLEPLSLLAFVMPGYPLIYSGQEAGNYKRLKFFDKDEISWKDDKMTAFYRKLNDLKRKTGVLWDGSFEVVANNKPDSVFSFVRKNNEDELFIILNLSGEHNTVNFENTPAGKFMDFFENNEVDLNRELSFALEPYGYKLLLKG